MTSCDLQDHNSDVHTGGSEGKGHIQVIAATDHTPSLQEDSQQHPVHLYYPNRWGLGGVWG